MGADIRVAGLTLKFDYYSADTKNMLTDIVRLYDAQTGEELELRL